MSAPARPIPVVIDTDPGIDDVLALLLALASPELEVRAIVTVYGNVALSLTTRNARDIIRRTGSRVPVVAGSARPLRRPLATAPETHGPEGTGYAAVPPAPDEPGDPLALYHVLAAAREPVLLLTLGPLTNLAHALARDGATVRRALRGHLAMAGALTARGTATPRSEFNSWCDPEAAAAVLAAPLETGWIGLDVTRRCRLTGAEVDALDGSDRRRWLRDLLRFYVEFHRAHEGFDGCVVNDPVIVAEALRPGLVRFEAATLRVGLGDGPERGRTAPDPAGLPARFGRGLDEAAMRTLLEDRVLAPTSWRTDD